MESELFLRAMAAVLKPMDRRDRIPWLGQGPSKNVQGIWNTAPMLTRMDRRYRGLLQSPVRSSASMLRGGS